MTPLQILIVDDDEGVCTGLEKFFREQGYLVWSARLPSEAFASLEDHAIDLVLLDIALPEMDGLQMLKKLKTSFPAIEVIMTGYGDTHNIVEAMRLGAFDFFTKPFQMIELQTAIERTNKFLALQQQLNEVQQGYTFIVQKRQAKFAQPIIGESQSIKQVVALMVKVAQTDDTSVLITGESGTGKALVARGIHALSQRKDRYFCEVNCPAIPESLFESELFGHIKGAFTGATENRIGYAEAAQKGTLFLDEIGDVSLACQAKLLSLFEHKTMKRLGSQKDRVLDIRIISATNCDLAQRVKEQRFRLDLLHRLQAFTIHIPPLRERRQDIPLLLEYYTTYFATYFRKPIHAIAPAVFRIFEQYDFPGNVRELRNLLERAVILCDSERLSLRHFSFLPGRELQESPAAVPADTLNLDDLMQTAMTTALQRTDHNKSEAAKLLGLSRHALNRKLAKYKLT
jgi:DNA-binding NtrC family response regulator